MNSERTKPRGLALRLRFVLAFFALAVSLGWVFLRHEYGPHGEDIAERALASWWRIEFAYGGAFLSVLAVALFLPFFRRLKKSVLVASIANLFMTGLLFGLHFVASDSSVQPVLARFGLGWLSPTFLALGVIWGVMFFYVFATEVDTAQHKVESGKA